MTDTESPSKVVLYQEAARQGRTSPLSFVAGLLLILFFWQFLGALPLLFFMIIDGALGPNAPDLQTFMNKQPFPAFLLIMLSFAVFMLGIWLAMRLVHRRKMRTLISADGSLRWQRFAQGFGVWLSLAALQSLVEALLYPGRYVWTFKPESFFLFLLPILLLIPIQTSAEELFFRGYLLQGFGLKVRSIWLLSLLSGVLFALPHMTNPEVSVNFWLLLSYYFLSGVFMAFVTLKDQRLELALGLHAANNIFTAVFANYTISALPTPALFTVQDLDAVYALTAYIISATLFYLIFFRQRKTDAGQNV